VRELPVAIAVDMGAERIGLTYDLTGILQSVSCRTALHAIGSHFCPLR
jgi:hypothetical protein